MLEDVYRNKNVFVTGSTGFKGSWLAYWLTSLGANVHGYSLKPNTNPAIFNVLNLESKINQTYGDLNDLSRLKKTMNAFNPDIVFHLAAQPLVSLSYQDPINTFKTNVMGTANVMEAIRNCKSVKAGVIISSDKCYHNNDWNHSYRENDLLGGYDPYSASKGCTEIITASYRDSFFNPKEFGIKHNVSIATARSGNVVGGGDWAQDRLIPDCIRSFKKNKAVILRNPNAVRPWQHVLDANHGYLQLGKSLLDNGIKDAEAWNFGPNINQILPVIDIVKIVHEKMNSGSIEITNAKFHEAKLLALDITKAVSRLEWRPTLDIRKTINWTIEWYQSYLDSDSDIQKLTQDQIKRFETLFLKDE